MTAKKPTLVPVEVDGFCDPETGICALPESLLTAGATTDAEDERASASETAATAS